MGLAQPWMRQSTQTWFVQFGKKQISLGKDKKKAFQTYAKLLHEQGVQVESEHFSLHALIDTYIDWVQVNRATTTWAVLKPRLLSLKTQVPDLPAEKLTPFTVDRWARKSNATSPTTVHNYIQAAIAMMNWGVKYGCISRNPIHGMPKPTPRMRQDFVPPERFAELLGCITNPRFRDFVVVMLESGARATEMFKFTAEHLRNGRFVLEIEDSKGKKRSRVVYLPPISREIAYRLAAEYPVGPIFRTTKGKPWGKESIRKHFRRLRDKLGMDGLCPTVLRHSFAHARLLAGQDSLTVSKLLGHVNMKMLSARYGHLEGSQFLADEASRINPAENACRAAVEGDTQPIADKRPKRKRLPQAVA
jgi:integrase